MKREANSAPTLAALTHWVGRELKQPTGLKVDQKLADCFAACTGDNRWIDVDADRAGAGPLGGAIAQGPLVASLLGPWTLNALVHTVGASHALVYGLDRLRFLNPVRCGARLRAHMLLDSIQPKGDGKVLLSVDCTLEIDEECKPALIATTLVLVSVA